MKEARAVRVKHFDNSALTHPWVVSFARGGSTYLYGQEVFEGSIQAKKARIAQWCDYNGIDEFTISESGSAVGFLTEDAAFLFYLAHA